MITWLQQVPSTVGLLFRPVVTDNVVIVEVANEVRLEVELS